jgi:hypothetical protein
MLFRIYIRLHDVFVKQLSIFLEILFIQSEENEENIAVLQSL